MSGNAVSWNVERDGVEAAVSIEGDLTDKSELSGLLQACDGVTAVRIDLAGVRRINSVGVRTWINFIRALQVAYGIESVIFERCSVAMVSQLNMIQDVQGRAKVVSFFAPYVCEASGDEEARLLQVAELTDLSSPPTFKDDRGDWELDDIPERYFAFLEPSRE